MNIFEVLLNFKNATIFIILNRSLPVEEPKILKNVTVSNETANEQENLVLTRNEGVQLSKQLSQQNNEITTMIQPSLNSQLLVNPGSTVRIVFDVTNLHQQTVFHNFQATGERSWLLNLEPRG